MPRTTQPPASLEAILAGTCEIDEFELRKSLCALIENLSGMAYRCLPDQHWTMLYVSASAEALTGHTVEDLVSGRQSYEALILPEDRALVRDEVDAARAAGVQFQMSYRITAAGGAQRWVWEQGQSIRHADGREVLEGYIVDVSAQRRLAARSEGAQRLERIGLLSASLLHDINNLMTPLLGNLDLLSMQRTQLPPEAQRNLDDLQVISDRIHAMLGMVRSLHRAAPASFCIPDDVLAGFTEVLRHAIPVDRRLTLELGAPDVLVAVSAADIERVVLNLVQNASEAGARTVTVRTDDEAGHLVIIVGDDGRGITAEQKPLIFAPLYTTRITGSGLGLSTVQRITRGAGGTVDLSSAPGEGTTFTVRLPHRPDDIPRASVILLLEANAFLRQQATTLLTSRGFRVLSCADNDDAMRKLQAGQRPDAVVTDMLSNADREPLLKQIRSARPDIPVYRLSELLLGAD